MSSQRKNRGRAQPAPTPQDTVDARLQATQDNFTNLAAKLGWGGNNLLSGSRYTRSGISRDWQQLAAMYRSSWIIGAAVDCVAEDMVRPGIELTGPVQPSDAVELIGDFRRLQIFERIAEGIKWGRLFGGAICVLLIEGQEPDTPLRLDTVEAGAFKGLLTLDRWRVQPTTNDLVTDLGPDLGLPKYYEVQPDAPAFRGKRIHYSRVVRFTGIDLPYHDAVQENLWGQSVAERLWDRLIAFDSTTVGAAQLAFRAYLRTIKIKNLRAMIGGNDTAQKAVAKQLEFVRAGQSNEGMTVLDAEDEFMTSSYSFAGLDSVLIQMGQQLSGAVQIPLVRLFGQSPSGFNSGESDLRNYYDSIDTKRETRLRDPVQTILDLLYRNRFKDTLPPEVGFKFNSLWQLTPEQRANIAKTVTDTVTSASSSGLISDRVALKELQQASAYTGVFTNITDEDIEQADSEPPDPSEMAPDGEAPGEAPGGPADVLNPDTVVGDPEAPGDAPDRKDG